MPILYQPSSAVVTTVSPQVTLTPNLVQVINTVTSSGRCVRVRTLDDRVVIESSRLIHPYATTTTTSSSNLSTVYVPFGYMQSVTTGTTAQYYTTSSATSLDWHEVLWVSDSLPQPKSNTFYIREQKRRTRNLQAKIIKAKSAIKKAVKLLTDFGLHDDIKVFLQGQCIEISHRDSAFKFVLQRDSVNLISATHSPTHYTPYSLSLYTKTDVHLADLCVYMDKTPVLDHVLAVSMYVQSGSEEEILKAANFRNRCSNVELLEHISQDFPYLRPKLLPRREHPIISA